MMKIKHRLYLIIISSILVASTAFAQSNGISMGNATAFGESSFAAGDTTKAIGKASLAFGLKVEAQGNYSFAAGNNNLARGTGAAALGLNTKAFGDYSFALGDGAAANGYSSIAIGNFAFTSEGGYGAIALGTSRAESPFSLAAGINNWASSGSDGAALFGSGNRAFSAAAFVVGQENFAYSFGETVIGQYSVEDPNGTPFVSNVPTDRIFTIGNGANSSERSNALVMLKNGDTDMTGNLDVKKRINIGNDDAEAEVGDIRYNQNTRDFEGFTNLGWKSLTAGGSPYGNNTPVGGTVLERMANVGSWHVPSMSQPRYAKISTIAGTSEDAGYTDYIDINAMEFNVENQNNFLKVTVLMPASKAAVLLLEGLRNATTYDELEILFTELNDVGTIIENKKYRFTDVVVTGVDFKYYGVDGQSNILNKDQELLYRVHFISNYAEIEDIPLTTVSEISLNN